MKLHAVLAAAALFAACGSESPPTADRVATAPAVERTAVADAAPTEQPSTRLLPDLQVSQPRELYIQYGADGVREIRFSTTIRNVGDGPLLMVGAYDISTAAVSTVQHIEHSDGTVEEYDVGRFVFDDGHDHWHLEDFIVFELWSLTAENQLSELVATTGKMTFCLADSHPIEEPLPNSAPKATVTSCDQEVQGISVGWEDIYVAELAGQELDIPDLPDGRYAIRSSVDPEGLLLETDDGNNAEVSLVDVAGMAITYVEDNASAATGP